MPAIATLTLDTLAGVFSKSIPRSGVRNSKQKCLPWMIVTKEGTVHRAMLSRFGDWIRLTGGGVGKLPHGWLDALPRVEPPEHPFSTKGNGFGAFLKTFRELENVEIASTGQNRVEWDALILAGLHRARGANYSDLIDRMKELAK